MIETKRAIAIPEFTGKRAEVELKIAKAAAEMASLVTSDLLSQMSHDFRTPHNAVPGFAQVGIEFARDYQLGVLLMDTTLPGISGMEAMQILRDDAVTALIPVVALSATAVASQVRKGLDAGFFRYLTKPNMVGELMDTLDVTLKYPAVWAGSAKKEVRA